jgi:hypothetical protein
MASCVRIVLSMLVIIGSALSAKAEERTIQASAPWEGRVRVYVTGPRQGFALGSFGGRLAVQGEPSALDGAQLTCPAAIEADYTTNTQRGEGRCVITAVSGDRLFARWTCAGEPDKGCAGRFTLTGGTGAYQGVTGEGDFALRLVLSDLVRFERLEADYDLAGLASWPALRYRTP